MDTKTEFNLNNIIATLSLISISSVKKIRWQMSWKLGLNSARWMLACAAAGLVTKSPDYTGGFVCLRRRLNECQSWWASTLRAMPPWRHNLCALRLVRSKTIDLHYVIGISGILPYNRNVTLQALELFLCTFARLYDAAASPASCLRSAGSLAIKICLIGCLKTKKSWAEVKMLARIAGAKIWNSCDHTTFRCRRPRNE